MNKKLLNQIYNIIFYSFAICSAVYFIISSIQKNEGLKSSDIIYIIFVINYNAYHIVKPSYILYIRHNNPQADYENVYS